MLDMIKAKRDDTLLKVYNDLGEVSLSEKNIAHTCDVKDLLECARREAQDELFDGCYDSVPTGNGVSLSMLHGIRDSNIP